MEKKVKVCDKCNQIIAEKVCEICDKDICQVCEEDVKVGITIFENGINTLLHIVCCKNCAYGLSNYKLKNYFDNEAHKNIRRSVIEIFKNSMVMNSLESKNNERKNIWTPKIVRQKLGEIECRRDMLGGRRESIKSSFISLGSSLKNLKGGK